MKATRSLFALLLVALVLAPLSPRTVAAAGLTLTVNSTADAPDAHPGDGVCASNGGQCTLRAATQEADAQPAGSSISIIVPAGTYTLTLGTLQLTANRITLSGALSSTTTISGTEQDPVLAISPTVQASISKVTVIGREDIFNSGGTLTLTNSTVSNVFGRGIDNVGTVTLTNSTVSGNAGAGGIFSGGGGILNFGTLTLINSTVSGNVGDVGGGIANDGTVTLTNSSVSGNFAFSWGGGIYNTGTMTLSNSTVSGNRTFFSEDEPSPGGGIYNQATGTMTLSNSTVSGNTTAAFEANPSGFGNGGGIYNRGTVTLTNSTLVSNTATSSSGGGVLNDRGRVTVLHSTLSRNTASAGGGIANGGTLTLSNSTLSGNVAADDFGRGGGIWNNGPLTLTNSTLVSNTAFQGGGVYNFGLLAVLYSTLSRNVASGASPNQGGGIFNDTSVGGTVALTGTILSSNDPGGNCSGPMTEGQGYNLDSGTSCNLSRTTDLTATDPLLGPLADNGGPTPTLALLPGSPAIDHGGTSTNGCPPTDQRGVTRPQGPACDIGAYEAQAVAHRLTVQTSGLGSNSTHISNGGTLLGTASATSPLSVSLPAGTPLSLTADALVGGADGTQYFFQGFTPPPPATLTTDVTTTARYETMAQIIGDALAAGGIYGSGAQGLANALTQQFAAVQADLAAHNAAQALLDTQSFINHLQAQTGKKITPATATTLVLDALLVYHAALCQAESAGQIGAAQATADYRYYSGLVTQLGAIPLGPC
jgi:CSLREA domain-containing protein